MPVNEYGLVFRDQPVLIGTTHTGRAGVAGDISRWEADHLALVVAETIEAATAGAEAIVAEWEPLPVLADTDASLASSLLLHPENGKDTNAYHHLRIRKGDVAAGWEAADIVIEGTYELPLQETRLSPTGGSGFVHG